MAKKKRVNKSIVKKTSHSKSVSVKEKYSRRISVSFKNFILFLILSVLSYGLFKASSEEIFVNLFEILYLLLAFVSLALFICFLLFLLLKWFSK